MTSYYIMFNLCKVYKDFGVLKMYPTWGKSNHGVLHKIAKKYKKVYYSSIVCKPPTPMKRKAANAIDSPSSKHRNLAMKTTPKPPKSPSCSIPKWRVKCVFRRVKFEEHQERHDIEGHSDSKKYADASFEDHSESHSPRKTTEFLLLQFLMNWSALVWAQGSMKRLSMWSAIPDFPSVSFSMMLHTTSLVRRLKNGCGGRPSLTFLMATLQTFLLRLPLLKLAGYTSSLLRCLSNGCLKNSLKTVDLAFNTCIRY